MHSMPGSSASCEHLQAALISLQRRCKDAEHIHHSLQHERDQLAEQALPLTSLIQALAYSAAALCSQEDCEIGVMS